MVYCLNAETIKEELEMKTKHVVMLSGLIIASMFVVSTGIAKQDAEWKDYAYGTLTDYENIASAQIVDGIWNLKIKGDTVWFYACYQEENLIEADENSPDGSIDILEFTLQGQPFWHAPQSGVGNEKTSKGEPAYVVFGKFQVKKQWALNDGTYTSKTWKTWMGVEVYDNHALGIVLTNRGPFVSDGNKIGTITQSDL